MCLHIYISNFQYWLQYELACLRFTCSLTVDFWFALKLQNVQLKGFSPVWIIIWRVISFRFFIILEQYGQANSAGPIIIGSFCKKTYQMFKTKFIFSQSLKIINYKNQNVLDALTEYDLQACLFYWYCSNGNNCKPTVFHRYEFEYGESCPFWLSWFLNKKDKQNLLDQALWVDSAINGKISIKNCFSN